MTKEIPKDIDLGDGIVCRVDEYEDVVIGRNYSATGFDRTDDIEKLHKWLGDVLAWRKGEE